MLASSHQTLQHQNLVVLEHVAVEAPHHLGGGGVVVERWWSGGGVVVERWWRGGGEVVEWWWSGSCGSGACGGVGGGAKLIIMLLCWW